VFARRLIPILLVGVLGTTVLAAATKRRVASDDFLISKWTTDNGLPQNTVTSIVQTQDGYLWVGTFGGLARFDGVKFTVFNSANTPTLESNRVLSLFEDKWARLWIGMDSGEVYVMDNGEVLRFSPDPQISRRNPWAMIADDEGYFYISSDSGLERYTFDGAGQVVQGSMRLLSTEETYGLCRHPDESIWVRIRGKISKIEGDRLVPPNPESYSVPINILRFDFAQDGSLIGAGANNVGISSGPAFREVLRFETGGSQAGFAVKAIDGSFWLQDRDRLIQFNGDSTTAHELKGSISSGSRTIFQDIEKNIWIGSNGDGLIRLTRKNIGSAIEIDGIDVSANNAIIEDTDGVIWIGGRFLQRLENGKVTKLSMLRGGESFPLIKALALSDSGKLWVGGATGLYRIDDNQLVAIPEFEQRDLFSLFFDQSGILWVGGRDGLWKYENGSATHFTINEGLANNNVHFITQTRDGTIWVGTAGGVSRLSDGKISNITIQDGLSSNIVRAIEETDDGSVWLGTYGGGLSRIRGGQISTVSSQNGLNDDFISRILRDEFGRFWLLGNLGISSFYKDDLDQVADGKKAVIAGLSYDRSDGMVSSEANGGHQPAGLKSHDGRLWFPMLRDIVIVDPGKSGSFPPRVVIEDTNSTISGEKERRVTRLTRNDEVVNVSENVRNLEINFTALSFTKPEKLSFFYKLEGLDEEWTVARGRRTAFYPYLPAGNYRFVVRAINADGIWSEPVGIEIQVAERFWESRWFASLMAIAALLLVAIVFWIRLEQLRARHLRKIEFARQLINAGEQERRRIATDLHDGLSQKLIMIKRWAELGSKQSHRDGSGENEYLERIEAVASESIDETRTIIQNLGPQNLTRFGLTESIVTITEQVEEAFGIVFDKDVDNIDGFLDDEAELSLYRMAQETINNVIKHSGSPRGRVVLKKENSNIVYSVTDYGAGMGRDRDGGNGLRNLEERADLLGGSVSIESKIDEGTKVTIIIPLRS
jgi:signal transduction histidine kinase/ligand-binding sensor domain-containing protein